VAGVPGGAFWWKIDWDEIDKMWRALVEEWLKNLIEMRPLGGGLKPEKGGLRKEIIEGVLSPTQRGRAEGTLKGACCIDYFNYPRVWQPIGEARPPSSRKVGVHFETEARYIDHEALPPVSA
jgi:hypothetical protein